MVIGIVIADEQEYKPMREVSKRFGGIKSSLFGDESHSFTVKTEQGSTQVISVLCGIGKVNAAASAAYLIAAGADIILNSGLSGGLSGVRRGDITYGTEYIEHDFDLTPLGFAKAQKPDQQWRYEPNEKLLDIFQRVCEGVEGPMVCGDTFIADPDKKNEFVRLCGAVSCDMESAAVASVCFKAKVPYLSIRRISDDASDVAADSYREMNDKAESALVDILLLGIEEIIKSY